MKTMIPQMWDKKQDWFWEGNIQKKIIKHLVKDGFKILQHADCERKEHGPDILAMKDNIKRIIEVKGFPSERYTVDSHLGKKGEKKRASRHAQSRVWFSEALMEVLLSKCEDNKLELSLGFPRFPNYLRLIDRTQWLREVLRIKCYIVSENGEVEEI